MWYTNNSAQWISLSDMMTWLMLIFLLISILVISEVKEFEEELKNYNSILRLSNVPRKAAIQMEKYLSNDTIQDDDIHNKLLGFLKELNSNDICNYVGDFQR